ncbi:unnamed protein product [Nippostrongylus brasiliensis]|uniref:CCHC-type domain-containing protein n=1 Tax=Nippostrongylus brasiliensis TaxID=27835 RepID=A0A0N4XWE7_NIPBR|nr:unnamed protein product [Nippostrongylus brasiliensis]
MDPRDEWEQCIERELRRKLEIVEETPVRPTEKLIQQKLKHFGNKCHDAWDVIETSQREFTNMMHSYDEFLKERGGVLHFYVKLKTLFCEHKQRRQEIVRNTENFVMAHEWYEILVAAHEAEELSRLEFLRELNEEVYYESTRPDQPGYPNVEEVHRDFSRETVSRIARRQLSHLDSLLDEEWATKENVKERLQLSQEQENKTLSDLKTSVEELNEDISNQMRKMKKTIANVVSTMETLLVEIDSVNDALRNLKAETENFKKDTKEKIDDLNNEQQKTTSRILESINEKHVALLKRVEEGNERTQEERAQDRNEAEQTSTESHEKELTSSQRSHEDTATVETIRHYQRRLKHNKEQLHEIEEFLRENPVRERHFGERRMRSRESDMRCVYCGSRGSHYSDACYVHRSVDERVDLLKEENRCLRCLEQHEGDRCRKVPRCFYCNFNKSEGEGHVTDHHGSICRRPEEFARAVKRRKMISDEIEHCYRRLDELGTGEANHAAPSGASLD